MHVESFLQIKTVILVLTLLEYNYYFNQKIQNMSSLLLVLNITITKPIYAPLNSTISTILFLDH